MKISRETKPPFGISHSSWETRRLRIDLLKTLTQISPFSDVPKKEFKGPRYLFSGCSITSGESLNKEESWPWKLYKKLQDELGYPADTFFNLACSGMSVTESIDQIFKYCNEFGNPDSIFVLFPDPFRDAKYCGLDDEESDALKILIYKSYFYLESFCKTNNIKLLSSTWYKSLSKIDQSFFPSKNKKYYPGTNKLRIDWSDQLNINQVNLLDLILSDFDSFVKYDEDVLTKSVLEFHLLKNKEEKNNSLVASDDVHPGTSFHDFWSEFFYKRYKEELNV
jgi:hypothetical protein